MTQITGDRLTTLFRPRGGALAGASDKPAFSILGHANPVQFGFAERTCLVNRRGAGPVAEAPGAVATRARKDSD